MAFSVRAEVMHVDGDSDEEEEQLGNRPLTRGELRKKALRATLCWVDLPSLILGCTVPSRYFVR